MELSDRIVDFFASNRIIEEEDRDIYAFGVRQGLLLILNVLSTLAVGLILGMLLESLLFLLFFMPLRCYAGGFHAKTPLRCYLYSLLLVMVSLLAVRQAGTTLVYRTAVFLAVLAVWSMAPVENETKPLNPVEKRVYKKRARITVTVECLMSFLLIPMGGYRISSCISASILAVCVMLVVEKIRKSVKYKANQ